MAAKLLKSYHVEKFLYLLIISILQYESMVILYTLDTFFMLRAQRVVAEGEGSINVIYYYY